MGVSFYDTLGVAKTAGPDFIEAAYQLSVKRLRERLDRGDGSARAELAVVEEAYGVLSDPALKAVYDAKLALPDTEDRILARSRPEPIVDERGSSRLGWLFAGLLLGAGAVGHRFYATNVVDKVVAEGAVGTDATRAGNEGRFMDGLITNQSKSLDQRSQISNRALDQRAINDDRLARQRDAQIELQQRSFTQSQAAQQLRMEAQQHREEIARIEKERRYYACMNAAIDLQGGARAELHCGHLR